MNRRIALIIPYFGDLPHWFPYFAKSVADSPILDVLLFTDAKVPFSLPSNIIIRFFCLDDFIGLVSRTLSLPVTRMNPYKTCDLKPAFGRIFEDYICAYDFWAFGDIDLIYGDIASFLEPRLDNYDLISCRSGWISGSLCVLRNCDTMNDLYKLSSDWRTVFMSSEYRFFDEMGGFHYTHVLGGADVLKLTTQIESFTHVVKRRAQLGLLRCAFEDLACEVLPWGETVRFHSGKLTRSSDDSEVMYIHYVVMKARFFEVPKSKAVPDTFYVRRTGVYLNKPNLGTHCSIELLRILRGSFRAGRRVIRRQLKRSLATV